jgi:hypothetical protein
MLHVRYDLNICLLLIGNSIFRGLIHYPMRRRINVFVMNSIVPPLPRHSYEKLMFFSRFIELERG